MVFFQIRNTTVKSVSVGCGNCISCIVRVHVIMARSLQEVTIATNAPHTKRVVGFSQGTAAYPEGLWCQRYWFPWAGIPVVWVPLQLEVLHFRKTNLGWVNQSSASKLYCRAFYFKPAGAKVCFPHKGWVPAHWCDHSATEGAESLH